MSSAAVESWKSHSGVAEEEAAAAKAEVITLCHDFTWAFLIIAKVFSHFPHL